MHVYDRNGVKLDPQTVDWNSPEIYRYTYRQEPGPINALGDVKFIFPNKHNVYMHDTPSRNLFNESERTFSSGCIRVEKPIELALYLLQGDPSWDANKIEKIISTRKPKTVNLASKPEVYLAYLTCWVDDDGNINYRNDIYERDSRLLNALNKSE